MKLSFIFTYLMEAFQDQLPEVLIVHSQWHYCQQLKKGLIAQLQPLLHLGLKQLTWKSLLGSELAQYQYAEMYLLL